MINSFEDLPAVSALFIHILYTFNPRMVGQISDQCHETFHSFIKNFSLSGISFTNIIHTLKDLVIQKSYKKTSLKYWYTLSIEYLQAIHA